MDNKENKKFNFRNVTSNQQRHNFMTPQVSNGRFNELDSVFNSTAYSPNDIIHNDADISNIASIQSNLYRLDYI